MKPSSLVAIAVVVTSATGQPQRHVHRHPLRDLAKRQSLASSISEAGPIATVIVYILNGRPISEEEVHQGIANGTLIWGDDGELSTSSVALPTPVPISVAEPSLEQSNTPETSNTPEALPDIATVAHLPNTSQAGGPSSSTFKTEQSHVPEQTPESTPQISESAPPEPSPQPQAPSTQSGNAGGVDREFPDGEFSCDAFPRGYGAEPIQHAGLGGWIGIQDPQIAEMAGFDDITTTPHGSCSDGTCCKPGSYCSYSCPPGYLKSSWPAQQGKQGQSVGGLFCNLSNKLEMASGAIAKTLCVRGTDKVTVKVQNNLKRVESICRTDYPGTESETIPITTKPGESAELACPETNNYYQWNGKATSAQYYINNGGISERDACQWGDGSKPVGNFAPINLGVGFSSADQKGYISLFQNSPTTNAKLDFTVELQADDMTGRCKYSKGEFRHGDDYGEVAHGDNRGCTVALNSGNLTVVLTEN